MDVRAYFILSMGFVVSQAFFIKNGRVQPEYIYLLHPKVEFSRAVFGTIALIGKEILVKFKSPLIIFFPISFIIYFPIDLIFET